MTDTQNLRERARHMREVATMITDERARQAALTLAIEYERQDETMTDHSAATFLDAEIPAGHSQLAIRLASIGHRFLS